MLRLFSKYYRSIAGIFIVGIVTVGMLFFGLPLVAPQRTDYAIKVNDIEIPFEKITEQRRLLYQRFRQNLGPNFMQYLKPFLSDLPQQIVDGLIEEELLRQFALSSGFRVGEREVSGVILNEVMGGDFNLEKYKLYLRQEGKTSVQFENELKQRLLARKVKEILYDLSIPFKYELEKTALVRNTFFNIDYIEVNWNYFGNSMPNPSKKELEKFYEEHLTEYDDFEIPARVSYSWIAFKPAQFKAEVVVNPEDIELYYSEHKNEFKIPQQARVKQIVLKVDKDEKEEEVRKEAEDLLKQLKNGADFSELAKIYSEDPISKLQGGDIGWVKKGEMFPSYDGEVFKSNKKGVRNLVIGKDSFYIIKVTDYKPHSVKPFESVKKEIIEKIKTLEAPSYARAKAEDFLEKALKEGLLSAAKKAGLKANEQPLSSKKEFPEGYDKLTSKVLSNYSSSKPFLIDYGDDTLLVKINAYKPREIPPLAEVRDKALKRYKEYQSRKKVRELFEQLLRESMEIKDIRELAKRHNLKVKSLNKLNPFTAVKYPATEYEVRVFLQAHPEKGAFLPEPVEKEDKVLWLQVRDKEVPKSEQLAKEAHGFFTTARNTLASIQLRSLLNRLKAKANIDIAPSALQ